MLLVFALGAPGLEMSRGNQTITVLDLYGNHIGSDGAVALAEALKAWLVMVCCCPEQSLTIDAFVHFRLRNRLIGGETCLCIAVVES